MFFRSNILYPAGEGGDTGGATEINQPSASGTTSVNSVDGENDDTETKFVTREAYERLQKDLVKFKTKAREKDSRLNEFESQHKAQQEAKLLEEKKFQEVIESLKRENEELSGTIGSYKNRDVQAAKYRAFTDAVGKQVPDKFLPVIPLDEIQMVDGEIDLENVKEVAGRFKGDYPEIFSRNSSSTPGDFPSGSAKKMTMSEYKALGRVKGSKWMQRQMSEGKVDTSS